MTKIRQLKTQQLMNINCDKGQNTIHEDKDIDVKDLSDEQNADQMKSDDHKANINEAATSEEQNTDHEISVDVSQHDHSYSKISAPKNNEEFRKLKSPSGKKIDESYDNEMSDGQVPHEYNAQIHEADPLQEQNTDQNVICDGQVPDDASKLYNADPNSELTQKIIQNEETTEQDSPRKKEKIHLVIEQLGMSTETEATVEDFELSSTAISDSFATFDVEESSFHSVDDETILSALYSGTTQNMSEQNEGTFNSYKS